MTDRNELRRLTEDLADLGGTWSVSKSSLLDGYGAVICDQIVVAHCFREEASAYIAATSPDVVLGLLDEIERLKGECDFFSARSEEERTNRGLAEKDFHQAMELVRKYVAERDQLRAVAVRLKDVIKELRDCTSEHGGASRALKITHAILACPEVEKL